MMYHHWTNWAVQNLSSIGIILVTDADTLQDENILIFGVTGITCVTTSIIIVVILLLGNDNRNCFGEIQHL